MTEKLKPKNELEKVLQQAQLGSKSLEELMNTLMSSKLFIASTIDISKPNSDLIPLLFDRNGTPMAAVFTDKTRTAIHSDSVKGLAMKGGKELLESTPKGYGLVINPGYDLGLEILPEGIKKILGR